MIKLLLCIAVVAFTTFCGYLCSRKYRQRRQFFDQFKEFNERFLSEVAYYRRPILEFCTRYPYKGEFRVFLEDLARNIQSDNPLDAQMESGEYGFLKGEDRAFLKDYFSMFGRSDSQSQKAYFSSANTEIDVKRAHARSELKKYGDLFVKLGLLSGILIVILIL